MRLSKLMILMVLIIPVSAHAADITSGGMWWTDKNKGWFFYDDPEQYEVMEEKQISSPVSNNNELFTEQMERRGKELMSRAMEDPTIENVKTYMEHNKAMLVMSDNFSKAWQKALMKYPHLLFDTGLTYATKDIRKTIDALKGKGGLYFIHSATCPACQKQAAELKKFEDRHGLAVFPVTLGGTLPEYPNAAADNGMAERLGIESVPAILVAIPSEGIIDLISQGFIDSFELERRLFNYDREIDVKEVEALLQNIGDYTDIGASDR